MARKKGSSKNFRKRVRRWTNKSGVTRERVYYYKKNSEGKWIRLKSETYKASPEKLVDSEGKLTKAGRDWARSVLKDANISKDEKKNLMLDFREYAKERYQQGKDMSLASWRSHYQNSALERMIFNYNVTPEILAAELNIDIDDVLNEDKWDFVNNVFKLSDDEEVFFEYDYDSLEGFKIIRR